MARDNQSRASGMLALGEQIGVTPVYSTQEAPASITELVNAYGGPGRGGGTRAVAILLGADPDNKKQLNNTMRTVQRYMLAEKGEKGERARGTTEKAHAATVHAVAAASEAKAEDQKSAALAKFAATGGMQVTVSGTFHFSEDEEDRDITSDIDLAALEDIIDLIQADELGDAAEAFDAAFAESYDLPGMEWDSYDSIEVWGE